MTMKKLCMGLIPALLSTFALLTGFLYGFWCESYEFTPIFNDTLPVLRFGPWYRQIIIVSSETVGGETTVFVNQGCASYPDDVDIDSKWKATRAFTVITAILGIIICAALWVSICAELFSDAAWKKLGVVIIFVMVLLQGLTFLMMKSALCDGNDIKLLGLYDTECQWGNGSTNNVVSIILWFLTGLVMLAGGAPKDVFKPSDSEDVRENREVEVPAEAPATEMEKEGSATEKEGPATEVENEA